MGDRLRMGGYVVGNRQQRRSLAVFDLDRLVTGNDEDMRPVRVGVHAGSVYIRVKVMPSAAMRLRFGVS